MQGEILRAELVCQKIIPNVDAGLAKHLKLRDDQRSLALFTASVDDITFIACDEATKKADIEVVYCESTFSALDDPYAKLSGEAIALLAAPNPAEARAGLEAAIDHVYNGAYYVNADEAGESIYMAHTISSSGSYLPTLCDVLEVAPGTPMAYCMAPPVEMFYAVDAALKAAEVQIAGFFNPPLNTTNIAGAIMIGTQSACKAACDAFAAACIYVANHPTEL
ncbi:MAG: ethanolamine utilization microcompartment protein EutL [Coriobacteriales bacterium]|jgi:ethanolamine utilization protein EutL|nr:ethanolamine utilization microcompartment protein EutL [Coriobacteriales bacterium]